MEYLSGTPNKTKKLKKAVLKIVGMELYNNNIGYDFKNYFF